MKWINHTNGVSKDRINILCFPYAGAGSGYFARWSRFFGEKFNLIPIQYPMRDNRMKEKMPETIQQLAQQLVAESKELFEYPYVVLGHCMGAYVAYEVACEAEKMYARPPLVTFISSGKSPENLNMLSTKEMEQSDFLQHYGVKELVESWDENYRNFFLPILRADSLLCEDYKVNGVQQISSKICIMYGEDDLELRPFSHVKDWEKYTQEEVDYLQYTGDHFFIDREPEKVAKDVMGYIESKV